MGMDELARKIGTSLKTLTVMGGVLGGTHAYAQDTNKETPEEPPRAEGQIPFPKKYFKIDDFVAAHEGTAEERRKLAEELFAHVLQHGAADKDSEYIKEMLFPLTLSGEQVTVRVLTFSGTHKEMRVLIFRGADTPVAVVDSGLTGTPSQHQLPIEEKGVMRPQGFIVIGEHPLANRIYLGILRQLMSRF